MKVLIACEESQRVCIEFRKLGHEAYSADIQECSGGHPEWHILGDVLPLIDGNCTFKTMDSVEHTISGEWDLLIAHPPCTHLAVSGAAWFEKKRADGRQREAIEFFMNFINARCSKIAVENPVNIMGGGYIKKWFPDLFKMYGLPIRPSQRVHPWQFGDEFEKTTCLWIKGLPMLSPTNIVGKGEFITYKSGKKSPKWYADAFRLTPEERAKARSKTFPGIAQAMANQWGGDTK